MVELVSQRELSRRMGVTLAAVQKAIATGRITPESNGKLNPEKCAAQWEQNTISFMRNTEALEKRKAKAKAHADTLAIRQPRPHATPSITARNHIKTVTKQRLPHLTRDDLATIDELLREALVEMASERWEA